MLIEVLRDSQRDDELRAGAAWALGQFASATSATALVDTFNSSPLEIKVEAARALLRIAEPQIPHLIDLLKNGDPAKRDGLSWVLARTGKFNPSDMVVGADGNLRKWMSYIVGYGKDKFVQGDVEAICKADPEVYFAASVLWQIVASWVNVLLAFCDEIGFHLAEDFYWFNPAKLPSPIEWVNKRKIRAKDSVNTVWWFSKTDFPKADVRKVLAPYSDRMKKLIEDPESFYTPKKRPSGHDISAGFGKDNGGAIPSNLLSIPNTDSNSSYLRLCKELGLERHPARFPSELPAFFIKMLTDEEDVVLDIFGGSNTTGFTAEALKRKWLTFEMNPGYLASSAFRFLEGQNSETVKRVLGELNNNHADYYIGETVCGLDPARKAKSKNESLGQGALFVSGANAK